MSIQLLSLKRSQLVLSQTPMQQERRKHRTAQDIKDIADTFKSVGQIHPIMVRPDPLADVRQSNDGLPLYEIVAGEGRYLGAGEAGVDELRAEVRDLTDSMVEEIQLIENLQRTDLPELVEAEGYEALQKRGHSVEEIATRTGKSKATVYARMKLLALCPDARKALRDGKVSASVALLIARIPGEDQQNKALTEITRSGWRGEPMNYREAAQHVHDNFMLRLAVAPFNTIDGSLLPSAGPCTLCPMRSGNNPDLFNDVSADVCTNPKCFNDKKAAHLKRELETAKATGIPVIAGAKARRILPQGVSIFPSSREASKQLREGYARPKDKCLDDPRKRTYQELADYAAPTALLQHPETGTVEKVYKLEDIADRIEKKGVKLAPSPKDMDEERKRDLARQDEDEKVELEARRAIFQAVIAAAPRKLSRESLAELLSYVYELGHGSDEHTYLALGWEPPPKDAYPLGDGRQYFRDRLLKLKETELAQLAVVLPLIDALRNDFVEPDELEAVAERHGVNVKKVRADTLALKLEPKVEKPKPAAKKKATTKTAKKAAKKKAARKAK